MKDMTKPHIKRFHIPFRGWVWAVYLCSYRHRPTFPAFVSEDLKAAINWSRWSRL